MAEPIEISEEPLPPLSPREPLGMCTLNRRSTIRLGMLLITAAVFAGCCTPCAGPCGTDACSGGSCQPPTCLSRHPLFCGKWFLGRSECNPCWGSDCSTDCHDCSDCSSCSCGGLFGGTSHCGPNCYDPMLDSCRVRRKARERARKSMTRLWWQTKSLPSCHFREGFTQAYVDMAEGGNGTVPAVPPERYWKSRYRTASGYARAEEWFGGYRTGASMAEAEGLSQFNSIPTSAMPVDGHGMEMHEASDHGSVIR